MSNQVQQREEEDPDDIDEVPIQADHFDRSVVGRVIHAPNALDKQIGQKSQPNDHVQRVHSGHREIKKEQNLRLMRVLWNLVPPEVEVQTGNQALNPLIVVLERLDHKE